jgi:DNA-binding XRE family transcriptional regulator
MHENDQKPPASEAGTTAADKSEKPARDLSPQRKPPAGPQGAAPGTDLASTAPSPRKSEADKPAAAAPSPRKTDGDKPAPAGGASKKPEGEGRAPQSQEAPPPGDGERSINRLREFRIERMMSKAELARKAGLSVLTVARIESGYGCRMDTKRKILKALGLRLSDRRKVFEDD